MPAPDPRVFLVLVRSETDVAYVLLALADLRIAGEQAVVLTPPARGIAFFADPERQAELDKWWRDHVPPPSTPVYLVDYEPGLEQWLPGMDGLSLVGHDT